MMMLQALLLATTLVAQDPKPPPKTVEDRLKELDEKLSALEKKQKSLSDENAAMEKEMARRTQARQNAAELTASMWIQRHAGALQLEDRQKNAFIELWRKWTFDDFDKPSDVAAWKAREEIVRKELTPAQIPLLARNVREDHLAAMKQSVSFFGQVAKLPAEKRADFEKAVLGRLSFEEGPLLLQAHPERVIQWNSVLEAVEASIPELSNTLSETEQNALRKVLGQWRPKQR